MSIQLVVANGIGPTGRLLRELLREQGLRVTDTAPTAMVSYGVPLRTTLPSLNRIAGRLNKMEQALELARQDVATVRVLTAQAAAALPQGEFPLLGRQAHHRGGTDITLCLQPEDVALRQRSGSEWFTPYIPSDAEYRCWVYRGRHLGSYQKVLRHPERYRAIGRNFANGFAFELCRADAIPHEAVDLGAAAVAALGLDFGAVDVLRRKGGGWVVLEVNTAPGVEGPRQVIQGLAEKVKRWELLGYPRRDGDREGGNV